MGTRIVVRLFILLNFWQWSQQVRCIGIELVDIDIDVDTKSLFPSSPSSKAVPAPVPLLGHVLAAAWCGEPRSQNQCGQYGVMMIEGERDVRIGCHTTLIFTPLSPLCNYKLWESKPN
jgi:hypothetical protein